MTRIRSTLHPRALVLALALGLAVTACASTPSHSPVAGEQAAPGDAAWAASLCDTIKHRWLERMVNTFRSDWSGEVQYLPQYPNPVDGGLSHAGPWDHLQDVPLLLYGPGYVKPGAYEQPADITDIPPTSARLLKFDYEVPDGEALTQALVPEADRPLPKLVVTLVWDSAGMDVLEQWPNDWPYLRSLQREGAWFTDAEVGIGNSNTPPGHAAIGTGAFPSTSGFIDEYVKYGGDIGWTAPNLLLWPTFGDVYDTANENTPKVGSISTLASHVSMMSHGALWNGGDRDVAVMRQQVGGDTGGAEAVEWNLPAEMRNYFRFPGYANDVSSIETFTEQLDREDGKLDGLWRDNSIEQLRSGFDTPARTPYQTQLIEAIVEREGFGKDDVPDLLYLNYKAIDGVGHAFGLDSVEMQDSVRYQDDALRELVAFLNEQVGKGQWVMALTADHGAQIPADVSGGIPIDPNRMKDLVIGTFDNDDDGVELFMRVRPTQLWVDEAELQDNGVTLDEIAEYIGGLTASQVARTDFTIPPGRENELVYEASFPGRLFAQLPCFPPEQA
ncbi:MAG: alkaline phosphatase family protein [Actinomycetota bacterium]